MTLPDHPLQDSTTFTHLFEQHHVTIFRFIYGLSGGTLHEVEDLTAETFLRAWKARERYEGDYQSAIGWLLTIARHLVIDTARRKKVRKYELSISDLNEWQNLFPDLLSDSAEGQAIRREQLRVLLNQLSTLSTERRELLVLRYILGWQVKQIAAHLGMVENTVSVYLHRTLAQIRESWPGEDL
jgi:RNA polymerase sigma-70 factor (ECF subfamily)